MSYSLINSATDILRAIEELRIEKELPKDEKIKPLSSFEENRLPKLPESWKWALSNDISTFITNGVHAPTKNEDELGINKKMLRITDLQNGAEPNFSNLPYCTRFVKGDFFKTLKKDDIYISFTGNNLGKRYIVKEDNDDVVFAHYFVRWQILIMNPKYVYYVLLSPLFTRFLQEHTLGSTQPNLKVTDLKRFPIPIAPLNVQNRIVEILAPLDEKINLNSEIINKTEKIGDTLFRNWFIDFEFPNEQGLPYRSSGGEMVESELGEIPKGWNIATISEFAKENIITGKTPSTKKVEYYAEQGYPFITIPDMHGNVFSTKTQRYLSVEGDLSQNKKRIPKNSLLVSCIATPGLVNITSTESHFNQQINAFTPRFIDLYYLYFSLKNLSEYIRDLGSAGSTTLNLNKSQFSKIQIIKPSDEILEKYTKVIGPFFEQIMNLTTENQRLIDLRDSLLPKLLSGDIEIPDESVVES